MTASTEKATFRLPRWEMDRLREESRRQRRSLNSVVTDMLARSLGDDAPTHQDLLRALGPMVRRPARNRYAPISTEQDIDEERVTLTDALDWTRGDR